MLTNRDETVDSTTLGFFLYVSFGDIVCDSKINRVVIGFSVLTNLLSSSCQARLLLEVRL